MATEHLDVIVVGAGISGICAGYHLQTTCPNKSYAIIEGRDSIGGTWDLFRYPGIRSDSDMYTLGFPFKPWDQTKSIADGDAILEYVRETAAEFNIDTHIRFNHWVADAAWDSETATWTLSVKTQPNGADGKVRKKKFTCNFLMMCSGYYRYDHAYTPEFPGRERFQGEIVHPQFWPDDFDYEGKTAIVIGSGATAMTLVPSMADKAAHVTMLQRSPTYVVAAPDEDALVKAMMKYLPKDIVYRFTRWRNALFTQGIYEFSQRFPKVMKRLLRMQLERQLPKGYDIDTHFKPSYNPWDQRMCLVPNGDLFEAIREGSVTVVTDHIDTFTKSGIRLKSGKEIKADIIITATGLELVPLGGLSLRIDGKEVDIPSKLTYKGVMLSDVPNLASVTGYTNASWTLKADLSCAYIARLIRHMDQRGYDQCAPHIEDDSVEPEQPLTLSAGYILRAQHKLPKQGSKRPWKLYQNYLLDVLNLRFSSVEDTALKFGRTRRQRKAA